MTCPKCGSTNIGEDDIFARENLEDKEYECEDCQHKWTSFEDLGLQAGSYHLGVDSLCTIRGLIEFAECSELYSKGFEQKVKQLKRDLFGEVNASREPDPEVVKTVNKLLAERQVPKQMCQYHGTTKDKCRCR